MLQIQKEIRKFANPEKAKDVARFFKTAPREYGYGDFFLGLSVPKSRAIASQFLHLGFSDLKSLLDSKYHEERFAALVILNKQFERAFDLKAKKQIVNFYLKNASRINNWDLVDVTAYKIIGQYCLEIEDVRMIKKLAQSKVHWERRMSMVSTLAFTKARKLDLVYELSEIHKTASEDLMHKALGWMLREAGKIDSSRLKSYLLKNGKSLPRTSVRYAIERFSDAERKKLLILTRP